MDLRGWVTMATMLALALAGCPTGDDDDSSGDDDDDVLTGLTVRGTVHDIADFDSNVTDVTVVIADPKPMLAFGEEPGVLGATQPDADGSFQVTGIDASAADMGLIMIVDDNGDTYRSAATGIDLKDYEGYAEGDIVDEQLAFAVTQGYVDGLDADLAAAGWDGSDIFATGALMGYVHQDDLTPIPDAVVSSTFGGDVFYADADPVGSGSFDDGSGTPNAATDAGGDSLWIAPNALVGPWACEADGYTFDDFMVGSTAEILVIIAFRPEA
jgi:hypothetical protein